MERPASPSPPHATSLHGQESEGRENPILLFGNVPFHTSWQRAQQLALCLAEQTPVVYIDPNHSFLQGLRRTRPKPAEPPLPAGLHHYQPPAGLPFGRTFAAVNRINIAQTLSGLRHYLSEQGFGAPRGVIVTYPDQLDAAVAFPGCPLIYDLMDEPTLFLQSWQRKKYQHNHTALLRTCDLLVTSSRVLLDRYRKETSEAVCITNGVRQQLLRDVQEVDPHPRLAKLPRPRLGYVGMISHWFDFAAVKALATAFPEGSIVLVGPADVKIPRLPSNVHLLGLVPHLQLPSILVTFDLGLIPFRRCQAIDAVNPIKLYEYFAAGVPVLSSRFEEIDDFGARISIYDDPAHCVSLARESLSRPGTEEERQSRRAFAREHSWSVKARQLLSSLDRISPATASGGRVSVEAIKEVPCAYSL